MKRLLLIIPLLLLCPNRFQTRIQRTGDFSHICLDGVLECGVALGKNLKSSLNFGLNYEILQRFGQVHGCEMKIRPISDSLDLCDSIRAGVIDLAILSSDDTAHVEGICKHVSPDGSYIWASISRGKFHCLCYDSWLAYVSTENKELIRMRQLFEAPYNPVRRAEAGIRSRYISPYDQLIKKYAREISWDWKMLAALIYTESKFTINNVSKRGAVGLMQVMPKTAQSFGISDLMDPEENIKAGTKCIEAIQRKYLDDPGFSSTEKVKFVLGCFNAGVGHISECRRICTELGMDSTQWDNVCKAMYLCENFSGAETRYYVDHVLRIYSAFCTICPY